MHGTVLVDSNTAATDFETPDKDFYYRSDTGRSLGRDQTACNMSLGHMLSCNQAFPVVRKLIGRYKDLVYIRSHGNTIAQHTYNIHQDQ